MEVDEVPDLSTASACGRSNPIVHLTERPQTRPLVFEMQSDNAGARRLRGRQTGRKDFRK
jgi:hypothetical protein